MESRKLGEQSIAFAHPPRFLTWANAVGKKEGEGPLRDTFDHIGSDDRFGCATWEQAECAMQKLALRRAMEKAETAVQPPDWLFAGDLLNQCVSSSYAARESQLPFFGLYGACSTMGEGLILAGAPQTLPLVKSVMVEVEGENAAEAATRIEPPLLAAGLVEDVAVRAKGSGRNRLYVRR